MGYSPSTRPSKTKRRRLEFTLHRDPILSVQPRMTTTGKPNMHPVDVVIVICVTLVVLVGLYTTAGCGGADFQVMDDNSEDSDTSPASADSLVQLPDAPPADTGPASPLDSRPAVSEAGDVSDSTPPPKDTATCEHSNGLGQSYSLCVPSGTPGSEASYSLEMAKRARAAWPTPGTDGEGACADGAPLMVWRKTATSCAAWAYTNGVGAFAGTAGRVYLGSTACSCPSSSCPAWN